MPVRPIKMTAGSQILGAGVTWGYPAGRRADGSYEALYEIPIYPLVVEGTDNNGVAVRRTFEVFRFGVQKMANTPPSTVGLADPQSYVISVWNPAYKVHSAASAEDGAWVVTGNYLIHDGPDYPRSIDEPYATAGCLELCGPVQFNAFNDHLISLSGLTTGTRAEKLVTMGASGQLSVIYLAAPRPPVKLWPV